MKTLCLPERSQQDNRMDQYNKLIDAGSWNLYQHQRHTCRQCCKRQILCPCDGVPCSTCRAEGRDCIYLPVYLPLFDTYISDEGGICGFPGQSKDVTIQDIPGCRFSIPMSKDDGNPEQHPRRSANNAFPPPPATGGGIYRANMGHGQSNDSQASRVYAASKKAMKLSGCLLCEIARARTQRGNYLEQVTEYSRLLVLLKDAVEYEPKETATVKAVHKLAIIEIVTCESLADIGRGLIHLDAAVRLMRQRKMDKVQDKSELAFILDIKLLAISQALLSTDRAADYISNFPEIASSLQQEPEVHINRLMCILGSLSHLRADIYWKMKKSREIYHQAEAISDELLKWADRSLSTIELSSRGGHILACHAMNQYRAAQLSVNSILSAYSSFGSRPGPKGFGSDICASVPFHLHAGLTKVPSPICGVLLLWPLFATATTTTEAELRKWVKYWLGVIGTKMGVGQSTVVLNMLEGKVDIPKGLACETQPYQNADLAAVLAPPSPTVLEQRQSDDSQINKTLQTKSIIPLLHDCFRTHGNGIHHQHIYSWFERTGNVKNIKSKDWKSSVRSGLARGEFVKDKKGAWTDRTLPLACKRAQSI